MEELPKEEETRTEKGSQENVVLMKPEEGSQ